MSAPLVSAIIPAYNAEAFIAQAVESVLGQTHPAVECIVVDDGSSDRTAQVAGGYRNHIQVVRQANSGVSAARNRGASTARADVLAFLDADDLWRSDRVERMLEVLDGPRRCDAVLCATQLVDRHLRPSGVLRPDFPMELRPILLCEARLVSSASNLLIRRRCFTAVGGFDTRLSTAADWALLLRIVDRYRLGYVDEPLTFYRRHDANMSRSIATMEHDMLLFYDETFAANPERADLRRIRRRAYANLRRVLAGSYFGQGDLRGFARNAVLSVVSHPAAAGYFLAYPARRLRARRARL